MRQLQQTNQRTHTMSHNPSNIEELNATPFEIATLAIQLAALRGQKEPAFGNVVDLLLQAQAESYKVGNLTSPYGHPAQLFHFLAPLKGPENLLYVVRAKTFAGGERIEDPECCGPEFKLDRALALISGEKDRKRRTAYRNRFVKWILKEFGALPARTKKKKGTKPEKVDEEDRRVRLQTELEAYVAADRVIGNRVVFWELARNLVPFCPRFKDLYPETATARKMNRDAKGRVVGKPTQRDSKGTIRKKTSKKRIEVLDPQNAASFTVTPPKRRLTVPS